MTATTVSAPKAKHIHVAGHKIRLRFVQQILWGVVLGLLSVGAMAAIYYIFTQLGIFFAKTTWDHLFSQDWWPVYRHGLRDVGEGVLAKFVVETFLAKWQKHPDERLSGGQIAWRVPALLIESLVLILVGIWLVSYSGPWAWHHIAWLHHHTPHAISVGGGAGTLFAGINWPAFIIGFVVAHALRPQWRPVGSTINLAFIEPQVTSIRHHRARLVAFGKSVSATEAAMSWLPAWVKLPDLPPTVRERICWLLDMKAAVKAHSPWMYRLAIGIAVAFLGLAGYGEYVLHVVAKGH